MKNLSRRLLFGFAAIVFLLMLAVWLLLKFAPEITLSFSQTQLQQQIQSKFPLKKCILSACVELSDPKIELAENSDRVTVIASFLATLGDRTMPGKTKFSGKPHYEQSSGNFYLQEVQVAEFNMTGNAPDFNDVVKMRGSGIVAAIMNRFPIYSVQDHPKYGAIAKLALKSVRVADGQLQVAFVNPLLFIAR